MTVKKSCMYCEYGPFEHLLILFQKKAQYGIRCEELCLVGKPRWEIIGCYVQVIFFRPIRLRVVMAFQAVFKNQLIQI